MIHNVDQINNELLLIDSNVSNDVGRFHRECGEITNIMNKVQGVFEDQQAGQDLENALYRALQNLIDSENRLQMLRQELHCYVQNIQK